MTDQLVQNYKYRRDIMVVLLIVTVFVHITLSAGLSTYGRDGKSLNQLITKADKRLYFAKENGRNQVIARDPDTHQ